MRNIRCGMIEIKESNCQKLDPLKEDTSENEEGRKKKKGGGGRI